MLMSTVETTGYHYKVRNLIRKTIPGGLADERKLHVYAPDVNLHLSPDAREANVAVCISLLASSKTAFDYDREQLMLLHKHLSETIDKAQQEHGLVQHPEAKVYAGVEATTRRNVPVLTVYASDEATLEGIVHAGLNSMRAAYVDRTFAEYHKERFNR